MCSAEDQELSEGRAVPSRTMALNSALAIASRSGASRLGRQVTGWAWSSPDVVGGVVAHFPLISRGTNEMTNDINVKTFLALLNCYTVSLLLLLYNCYSYCRPTVTAMCLS
jgi:hypothetical protein